MGCIQWQSNDNTAPFFVMHRMHGLVFVTVLLYNPLWEIDMDLHASCEGGGLTVALNFVVVFFCRNNGYAISTMTYYTLNMECCMVY